MQKIFQTFLICIGFLLLIFVFDFPAYACRCLDNETVDKKYAGYPNVVILKLQTVKEVGESTNSMLSVERVFKGALRKDEILVFGPSSECAPDFSRHKIGDEFLVYLERKPDQGKLWRILYCAQSTPTKYSAPSLRYLEKVKEMHGKTRLSGVVEKLDEDPFDCKRLSVLPLANRNLLITGNGKKLNVVTDENGVYEMYDLPPGKYRVRAELIDGYEISVPGVNYYDVEIFSGIHTEQNFIFSISNEISGKVLDANGNPLEDVYVDLVSANPEIRSRFTKGTYTNNEGRFEFSTIPIGKYLIVVNKDDQITAHQPFHTFYFPNVNDEAKAAEIAVGPDFYMRDIILVPPEIVETVSFFETSVFADHGL